MTTADPLDGGSAAERWRRVKSVFHAVVEAPREERASLVRELAAGDHDLIAEVHSLLEADARGADLLESSPVEQLVSDIGPGQRIGAYRIEHEIGRGGMGTVYRASRADGAYDREVALKLIRRGIDTEHVLRRFHNERHILARLDHPNIARLLDAGTTEKGRPYFVMEAVEGTAIDDYCTRRDLSVDECVRLFIDVCRAVESAHRALVIHRDLKPANIVVTSVGIPKLLDFGIARMLDAADGQLTATAIEHRILTPEYASPEQLLGEPVGFATDVYSLGVVLYELLAGVRPHHRPSGEASLRAVNAEPERPSTAAARHGTAGEAERRRRRLKGDLDNIVLMALRADPRRRYGTVHEFAEDLQRFLDGRPVVARPDSISYRMQKFIRRNRAAAAALLLVAISLVGGIIATSRQAEIARSERARAERRYAELRKLTDTLLVDLQEDFHKLAGGITVRQEVAATVLRYLHQLDAETGGDPDLKLDLATAFRQAGSLAFDMRRAHEAYQRAVALAQALSVSHPSCTECRAALAVTLIDLADLHKMMGNTDLALEHASRARAEALKLVRQLPANREYRLLYQQSQSLVGFILQDAGEHAAALVEYRRAAALAHGLVQRWPDEPSLLRREVLATTHLGINLGATGRTDEAVRHLREAVRDATALSAKHPMDVRLRRDLWQAQLHLGSVLHRQRVHEREGLQYLRAAESTKTWLHEADRGDTGHQRGLAVTKLALAEALLRQGDSVAGRELLDEARRLSERLVAADPLNCESAIDLASIHRRAAAVVAERGDAVTAREKLRLSEELLRGCLRSKRHARVRQELALTTGLAYRMANR